MSDPQREAYLRIVERRSDIDGRFVNLRRVGRAGGAGCFSLVFSAIDSSTGQEVAIKVFRPDQVHDHYRYQCFLREAKIAESLQGQQDILGSICGAREFNEQVSTTSGIAITLRFPYFALELASHDVDLVVEQASWSPEHILENFRTMCRAVQRIHRRQISHRDLKPSNFLVLHDGEVRLSDFGTARNLDGEPPVLPNYMFAPGDLRYTAPEMLALLHDDDPAIAFYGDFFSLGAILFELCTGTKLGIQIFDHQFRADLAQAMAAVKKGDRRRIYDQCVAALAHGHSLPDIRAFSTLMPSCIAFRVDGLYKAIAALDYRKRLCDFDQIFRRIDQSLIVLRNEEKYRRWRQLREIFKQRHDAKRLHQEASRAESRRDRS